MTCATFHKAVFKIAEAVKIKVTSAYSEAGILEAEMPQFGFILCLVIWHDILVEVTHGNKLLWNSQLTFMPSSW